MAAPTVGKGSEANPPRKGGGIRRRAESYCIYIREENRAESETNLDENRAESETNMDEKKTESETNMDENRE